MSSSPPKPSRYHLRGLADPHVFGDNVAEYFELRPKITAPTLALLRPCPPYADPADVYEIGRLRWSHDRQRVEFRGNDLTLSAADVACIARALDACSTPALFARYSR